MPDWPHATLESRMHEPVYYHDYLGLDQLLDAQHLASEAAGRTAHDEMLFILIHQAYELWFKQILWELDSVMAIMSADHVTEPDLSTVVHRLERITEIQRVLIQQLHVLETMTPLDFMDFRDHLTPASGFQSVQFRLIENRLGLRTDTRLSINDRDYRSVLAQAHADEVTAAEQEPSLRDDVIAWLERTPFTEVEEFAFWREYRDQVDALLASERERAERDPRLTDEQRRRQVASRERTRATFQTLFDRQAWDELVRTGERSFTHRAFVAALMISLYGHEPALALPHRLLTTLVDIDEGFALWRHRHSLMVHRMIGGRIGTGGTSGHEYLAQAATTHRVFLDLFDLATFSLPRHQLPVLPDDVRRRMGFVFAT